MQKIKNISFFKRPRSRCQRAQDNLGRAFDLSSCHSDLKKLWMNFCFWFFITAIGLVISKSVLSKIWTPEKRFSNFMLFSFKIVRQRLEESRITYQEQVWSSNPKPCPEVFPECRKDQRHGHRPVHCLDIGTRWRHDAGDERNRQRLSNTESRAELSHRGLQQPRPKGWK